MSSRRQISNPKNLGGTMFLKDNSYQIRILCNTIEKLQQRRLNCAFLNLKNSLKPKYNQIIKEKGIILLTSMMENKLKGFKFIAFYLILNKFNHEM